MAAEPDQPQMPDIVPGGGTSTVKTVLYSNRMDVNRERPFQSLSTTIKSGTHKIYLKYNQNAQYMSAETTASYNLTEPVLHTIITFAEIKFNEGNTIKFYDKTNEVLFSFEWMSSNVKVTKSSGAVTYLQRSRFEDTGRNSLQIEVYDSVVVIGVLDSNGNYLKYNNFASSIAGSELYLILGTGDNTRSIGGLKVDGLIPEEFYDSSNWIGGAPKTLNRQMQIIGLSKSSNLQVDYNLANYSCIQIDMEYKKMYDGRWDCGLYNPTTGDLIGISDGENIVNTVTGLKITGRQFYMNGTGTLQMKLKSNSLYIKGYYRDGTTLNEYTIPITQDLSDYYFILRNEFRDLTISSLTMSNTDIDLFDMDNWENMQLKEDGVLNVPSGQRCKLLTQLTPPTLESKYLQAIREE